MRWLAWLVACAGCDVLFRVDAIVPLDAPPRGAGARDASSDGGPDGALPYCQAMQRNDSTVRFCADFDTPTSGLNELGMDLAGGGSFELTTPAQSDPKALGAVVDDSFSGVGTALAVAPSFGLDTQTAIEFDLDVLSNCLQTVTRLHFADFDMNVALTAGGMFAFAFDDKSCSAQTMIAATSGMYEHVTFELLPPVSSVGVSFAGQNFQMPCIDLQNENTVQLQVGTDVAASVPVSCETLIDNVVIAQ